jgi:predicted HAD superfamily Cof-like phosphohydrolase
LRNFNQKYSQMKELLDSVSEFHRTYRVPMQDAPLTMPSEDLVALRHRLMAEENEEYLDAARAGNRAEVADALGDQLYILCGTIITHGMQDLIEEVFREIHRSNLSKLGADGQPLYREDGKVMKGPNYFRPDIAAVLDGRSPQRSA